MEPVYDFPGANEWFTSARTSVALRPGPYTQALQAARFSAAWCDGCGRRRGADGRCPACDPWWTSPFYVYGSLLTLSVTALLLTVLPLLRPRYDIVHTPTLAAAAPVLAAPTIIYVTVPAPVLAPPVAASYRAAMPAMPFVPPVIAPAPPAANDAAALADLNRLRALTDRAAGVENRQEAVRALTGPPPPTPMHLPGTEPKPPPPVYATPPLSAPLAVPNDVPRTTERTL